MSWSAPKMFSTESIAVTSSGPGCCTGACRCGRRDTRSACCASSHLRSVVDVRLVGRVVDRVRLRHPHDVARLDLRRVDEADLLRARACPARSGPRRPSSTSRRPRSRRTRARGTSGRPSPSTATSDRSSGSDRPSTLGVVDVDPVVGERRSFGHHERDGDEVAVASPSAAALHLGGTGGSIARSSALIGIDEITWVHSYASRHAVGLGGDRDGPRRRCVLDLA